MRTLAPVRPRPDSPENLSSDNALSLRDRFPYCPATATQQLPCKRQVANAALRPVTATLHLRDPCTIAHKDTYQLMKNTVRSQRMGVSGQAQMGGSNAHRTPCDAPPNAAECNTVLPAQPKIEGKRSWLHPPNLLLRPGTRGTPRCLWPARTRCESCSNPNSNYGTKPIGPLFSTKNRNQGHTPLPPAHENFLDVTPNATKRNLKASLQHSQNRCRPPPSAAPPASSAPPPRMLESDESPK